MKGSGLARKNGNLLLIVLATRAAYFEYMFSRGNPVECKTTGAVGKNDGVHTAERKQDIGGLFFPRTVNEYTL